MPRVVTNILRGRVTFLVVIVAASLGSPVAPLAQATTQQTVIFDAIPTQVFGVSPFPIAAKASSGLPVGFTSTTPAVCKLAADLVTLLSAGTCSIMATQVGGASYSPATPVARSFTVRLARPSGTLTAAHGSPFAVGTYPIAEVVGDFNGDGIQDLAVADSHGNVTVLLGNGSGGFAPASGNPFILGADAVSMVVGDFNGDGAQDLAVVNGINNVTVLLGNGTGGFTAAAGSPLTVGAYPHSVVVGDFNGDGIQDLATANYGNNTVSVLLGNGSGGFVAATGSPITVGTTPTSLAVGDFNGDGIQDLAVANAGNTANPNPSLIVLLGNGSGGFTSAADSPFTVGAYPCSVVVGDFNGDGIPDLAVANETSANVTILLGNGSGGFASAPGSPFAVGGSPDSLVSGDFNGDGIPDLATANSGTNPSVLLGNGSGGFTAAVGSPFTTTLYSAAVVVGDFNGDGIQDLAATNPNNNNVTVLLGGIASTSSVLSSVLSATSPRSIALGQSLPMTLTVSDTTGAFNAPTGTATFLDGATVLGTASQTGSPYTFSAPSLSIGSHTLSATYGGDVRSFGSTSNSVIVQVVIGVTISTSVLPAGVVNVTYAGTALAAQGGTAPYSWTAMGLPPGLALGTGGALSGTPTTSGNYTPTFTVKDSSSPQQTAQMGIPISIASQLTVITVVLPPGVVNVTYAGTALAAQGGTAPYSWTATGLPPGLALGTGGALSGTPTTAGNYTPIFTVKDSSLAPQTAQSSISATIAAQLTITTSALLGGVVNAAYTGTALAGQGGTAPYNWTATGLPPGLALGVGGALSGTPTTAGNYTPTFTVKDSSSAQQTTQRSIPITIVAQLTIATTALPGGVVNAAYAGFSLVAQGGNMPYSWTATGLPPGLVLSTGGILSGTPTTAGSYTPAFTAKDSSVTQQTAQSSIPVMIAAQLTITTSALLGGVVNAPYAGATLAAQGATAPYSWTATGLPPGLALNIGGALSGTPTTAGNYTPTFTVKDSSSAQQTAQLSIPIMIGAQLTITTAALSGGVVNAVYATAALAAQGGTAPYSWAAAGLPPGLTLTAGGTLSGTPTTAGSFSPAFTVQDSSSAEQTARMSIPILIGVQLTITTTALPGGTVGQSYTTSFQASGGTQPFKWSVTSGSLPGGVSLSSSGTFSGVPTVAGVFTIGVKVTDSSTPSQTATTEPFTITVAIPSTLIVSPSSLSFTYQSNSTPSSQALAVSSAGGLLSFIATAQSITPSGANWLAVSPASGTTPSNLAVSLVNTSSLAPGTYSGTVTVSFPDNSGTQTVNVTLTVGAAFDVQSPALQFTVTSGTAPTQSVLLTNLSPQDLTVAASSQNGYVSISPAQTTISAKPGNRQSQFVISAMPSSLPGGLLNYADSIALSAGSQSIRLPVSISLSGSSAQPLLSSTAVTLFTLPGVNDHDQTTVQLLNAGSSPLDFFVSYPDNWIDVTPIGPVCNMGPFCQSVLLPTGRIQPLTIATNDNVTQSSLQPSKGQTLAVFTTSATVRYGTAGDVVNIYLDVPTNLPNLPPRASAAGVLVGLPGPQGQPQVPTITLTNYDSNPASFTIAAPAWLPVTAPSSSILKYPGTLTLTVGPPSRTPTAAEIQAGPSIQLTFPGTIINNAPYVLPIQTVWAGGTQSQGAGSTFRTRATSSCTPTQLTGVFASPASQFQVTAGLPVSLVAQIADNCGNVPATGAALVTFTSGESPLSLTQWPDGLWRGTWQPQAPQTGLVTLQLSAASPTITTTAQAIVTGTVTGSAGVPVVMSKSVVDAASQQVHGDTISPGEIISIYGTNLATQMVSAPGFPVAQLGSVTVTASGTALPLFFVSPSQVNAVVPSSLTIGQTVQLVVTVNGVPSVPLPLTVVTERPGIFTQLADGTGAGALVDNGTPDKPASYVVDATHPAHAGDIISIYCTGLGPVHPPVDVTQPAPNTPLSNVTGQVSAIIGNASAEVLFAGLAPGFSGLYQVNARVPANAATGNIPVQISVDNIPSNGVTLAVQ